MQFHKQQLTNNALFTKIVIVHSLSLRFSHTARHEPKHTPSIFKQRRHAAVCKQSKTSRGKTHELNKQISSVTVGVLNDSKSDSHFTSQKHMKWKLSQRQTRDIFKNDKQILIFSCLNDATHRMYFSAIASLSRGNFQVPSTNG